MLLTSQNIKTTLIMCIVMALTLFFFRGFSGDVELTPINIVPYLSSAFIGLALVFLYLLVFPSQRKNKFLTFFIPGIAILFVLIFSSLANLWLIDELSLTLAFMFGGQELSKPQAKSL